MSSSEIISEGGGSDVHGAEVVFEFDPGPGPGIHEGGDGEDNLIDNCSEDDVVTEPQLNLNGYCFLCLEGECEQSWMEEAGGDGMIKSKSSLKSFKTLLAYLTGGGDNWEEGEEEETKLNNSSPPPLCFNCYNNLTEIDKLHLELLQVQKRIQSQVGKVRECVAKTVIEMEEEEGKCRRSQFLESLNSSSSIPVEHVEEVTRWLIKVHDQIITKVDNPINFSSELPPSPSDQVIKVIEVDPVTQPSIQSSNQMTILEISEEEGPTTGPIDSEGDQMGSSSDKQKLQVEFITIEEYTANVQGHLYHVSQGEDPRIVEIPYQEEEQIEMQMEVVDGIENEAVSDSDNQHDKQCLNIELPPQQPEDDGGEDEVPTGGDNEEDDSSVTIAGVPVDPSANYVMITTNVTDPTTGVVSVQPILISVAQLQAMQHQQQSSLSPSSITPCPPPTIQPSGSGPKNKCSKKEPLGAYSTPSEYLYYHSDHQPCDVCNCHLPRGPQIASHLACHVGSDNVFYCSDCQLGFISPYRLAQYHRSRPTRCRQDNSNHSMPLYNCDLCSYSSSKPISFRKHLESHDSPNTTPEGHLSKKFQCPLCPLRFPTQLCLSFHLSDKHIFTKPSGRQKCDICSSFFDLGEIESHLWSHGYSDLLRCKLCMCIFTSLETLITHQTTVKRRALHDISCHVCASRFIKVRDLRVHYFEEHSLGAKWTCEKCKEEFYSEKSYQGHQRKCEDEDKGKVAPSTSTSSTKRPLYPSLMKKQCGDCGKSWSNADGLLRHRIKEHGESPLKCSDCRLTFNSEGALRAHVAKEHKGYTVIMKPWNCDKCGESFERKDKLKKHKFVKHCEDKPWSCEVCGLTYRNRRTLRDHVNFKHWGKERKKDKECDICGRRFWDGQVLKNHKLIHGEERPWECDKCGQRFRQRGALRTHKKGHNRLGEGFKPKGEMGRGAQGASDK